MANVLPSFRLQYLSVPLFTVFKNLTIILTAYVERGWFGGRDVTALQLISFALMVFSSVLGGVSDFHAHPEGYIWMLLNSCASCGYVLMLRRTMQQVAFKDFDTVYYGNILALPVLVVMGFVLEDWHGFALFYGDEANAQERMHLLAGLFMSGLAAFGISYATAWCLRVTSGTTYSMIGALNKLPIVFFGALLFNDTPATWITLVSVACGLSGGILYAHARNIQLKQMSGADAGPHRRGYQPVAKTDGLDHLERRVEGRASTDDVAESMSHLGRNGGVSIGGGGGAGGGGGVASWIPLEEVRGKSGQVVSQIRRV